MISPPFPSSILAALGCALLAWSVQAQVPSQAQPKVDEAWTRVQTVFQFFKENPSAPPRTQGDNLKRKMAEKLAEMASALKEFRAVATEDPRRWDAKLIEIELTDMHAYVGQPENTPDMIALAEEILTAPDASTEVKREASAIRAIAHEFKGGSVAKMSPEERRDWRTAAQEHLKNFPDHQRNEAISMILRSSDTDGDIPAASSLSPDEAWAKVRAAIDSVEHPSWKDIANTEKEAVDQINKAVADFEVGFKTFSAIAPKDSRRWEARVFQLETFGRHAKSGHPEREISPQLLREALRAAPDATEEVKANASGWYVMVGFPAFMKADKKSREGRRQWRVVAEEHLKKFPKGKYNPAVRIVLDGLAMAEEEEKRTLATASPDELWKKIEAAMETFRNPPRNLIGNPEKLGTHLLNAADDYDAAIGQFLLKAPSDPRRWEARVFEVEMSGMRTFLRQSKVAPDIAALTNEVMVAQDATITVKGNASALQLLFKVNDLQQRGQATSEEEKVWQAAATAHLNTYPNCKYNPNVQKCQAVVRKLAGKTQ